MIGEDGMMTTVINHSGSSAKDVSESDMCVTEYVIESVSEYVNQRASSSIGRSVCHSVGWAVGWSVTRPAN